MKLTLTITIIMCIVVIMLFTGYIYKVEKKMDHIAYRCLDATFAFDDLLYAILSYEEEFGAPPESLKSLPEDSFPQRKIKALEPLAKVAKQAIY